jgi:hypothetical protein
MLVIFWDCVSAYWDDLRNGTCIGEGELLEGKSGERLYLILERHKIR